MLTHRISTAIAVIALSAGAAHSMESPFPASPNETTPWHVLHSEHSSVHTGPPVPMRHSQSTIQSPYQTDRTSSSRTTGRFSRNTTLFPYSPNETGLAW